MKWGITIWNYVIPGGRKMIFSWAILMITPNILTQGEHLTDLENGLREIYGWINDGTLKIKEQKGILKIT